MYFLSCVEIKTTIYKTTILFKDCDVDVVRLRVDNCVANICVIGWT